MTIDERLEKLAERHEALTQSVELLKLTVEQQSTQIAALASGFVSLREASQQDGENIRGLARIAEIHERRLTEIEGGEQQHRPGGPRT